MFFTVGPDAYSAPPVEIWTMPSLPASAKPARAALSVCEDVTLMAGYANAPALARSSISAQPSGDARGLGKRSLLERGRDRAVPSRQYPAIAGARRNRPGRRVRL